MCGIFIANKGVATGDSASNHAFLIWLNQSKHHFRYGIRQISEDYQESLEYEDPRQEFFDRVDGHKNKRSITGQNACHLKRNFSMPNIGSDPVNHDSVTWAAKYSKEMDSGKKKQMRTVIFRDTKKASKNGFFINGHLRTLDATAKRDMQKGTKPYVETNSLLFCRSDFRTEIEVINGDTIDVALSLQKQGYKPVAMNMANERYPGGGAERGAAAQEESIFRRTNYYESLYLRENPYLKEKMPNKSYCIPEKGAIYSPDIQVFRASEKEGFAFIDPEKMSFIAVAAYNLGDTRKPMDSNSSGYINGMKEKIRSFLRVAYLEGHNALVLGALGCGAFANDSTTVAQFFKDTLEEPEFAGRFQKIVFAVIDDHNGKNFRPFSDVLEGFEI